MGKSFHKSRRKEVKSLDGIEKQPTTEETNDENHLNVKRHDDTQQCRVLYDILDIFNSKTGLFESVKSDSLDEILTHPVIATFIWKKWQKTQWFYYFISMLFAFFLLSYSWIVYITFAKNDFNLSVTVEGKCGNCSHYGNDKLYNVSHR